MRDSLLIRDHIFGEGSQRGVESVGLLRDTPPHLNEMVGYEVMLVLFVALYMIYIGRTLANHSDETMRIKNPFAPIVESEGLGGSLRIGDVLLDCTMIIIMIMLFTSRIITLLQPHIPSVDRLVESIVERGVAGWLLGVGGAFLITVLYGIVNVTVMCTLLRREAILRQLNLTKIRLLNIAVVWIFPILLLSAMEGENLFFSYIAIIQIFIFIAIYLFRCFLLFTSQKISILHWILYLCAVEIFPLTLWWALFVR